MISHEDISYCVVWLFLFHTREPYPRALKVLVVIYGARVPPISSFGCHYRGIFWFRSWQGDDLVGFSLKGICKLKVHGCGAFHIANDDLNCLASLQSFLFLSRVAYRVSSLLTGYSLFDEGHSKCLWPSGSYQSGIPPSTFICLATDKSAAEVSEQAAIKQLLSMYLTL